MASAGQEDSDTSAPPEAPPKASEQAIAGAVADMDAPPPQELREDQIENAIAFLAHPKVRGSTVASKRSFLERKGLTSDEIDEAVRRVPEAPAPVPTAPAGGAVPVKPYPTPSAAALQPYQAPAPPTPAPPPQPPAQEPIRWTQAVVGLGVVAAGAYGVHALLAPRVSQWYRTWRYGEAPPSDAAAQERHTAELVAAALKEQAAEVRAAVESVRELARAAEKGKAPAAPADALSLADLHSELRSFGAMLSELGDAAAPKQAAAELREAKDEIRALKDAVAKLAAPAPAPAPVLAASASRPNGLPPAADGAAASAGMGGVPGAGPPLGEPPHPASYMEVLEMLENGETPPGIRADINDTPPDPAAPPPPARLALRPKPWERAASAGPPPVASMAAAAGAAPGFPPASRLLGGSGSSRRAADGAVQITEIAAEPTTPTDAPATGGSSTGAPAWKPPAVPLPTVQRRAASATMSPAASMGGAPAASESSTSEQPIAAGA
ncbi:hypothetical protein WJX81_004333 [Elliptochloris bilobata]|uniref:Peroxisomal membrane protein PEX14 n=1 Tax=Elliptochloris bilobata TaxID=381761 RepID=A0AAW1R042_9CHLO